MKAFVVIATKGRAKETYVALDYLAKQTYPIEKIFIIGSESSDIQGLDAHPLAVSGQAIINMSPTAGSCIQRNVGLDMIRPYVENIVQKHWFITFYDDDFRPANNWIESAANTFVDKPYVVGVSGFVLADGIQSKGLSEIDAVNVLSTDDSIQPEPWFKECQEVTGLYGCNMAYRGTVASAVRFDENLPFYGWQEDIDYGGNALKYGKLIYTKQCKGVHLGASSGRTSGIKFGYSQVANPIYLARKGTMPVKFAVNLMVRNIVANLFKTSTFNSEKDFKGRLYGNFLAIKDLINQKCHPTNILSINK